MAALTAGIIQVVATARISGAKIAPQGTAASPSLDYPATGATGTGQQTTTYGTASGKADILCAADYTLAAGASVTLDLYTGTDLPNLFGGTAAFRKVKALFLGITSGGDGGGVTIGNAAATGNALFFGSATQTWTVFPSGPPLVGGSDAGVAVTNLLKNVKLLNGSAVSVTVRLILAGTSV